MILNHNAILSRVVSAVIGGGTTAGSRVARGPGKTNEASPRVELFVLGGQMVDHSGGKSVRLQCDAIAKSPGAATTLGEQIGTILATLTGGSPDVQSVEEEEPDEQSEIVEARNGEERTSTNRRIYTITYY